MAPPGLWSQLLLLSLGRIAAASPIDTIQHILNSPDAPSEQRQHRKLQGRFLHITDFHPDEFYKTHASTEEGIACHRGKGLAGAYGAETTDCDSPFSLVNATFDWIEEHLKDDIDFVVWTGDTARHDSDEKRPRNSEEVLRTNQIVADKFIDTFSKHGQLTIPVVPTFGNNDFLPHNIFYPGPNRWLRSYAKIWKRFVPEAQRHLFEFGGWFWTEVVPNQLAVFSLNTMYFFDRNAGVDGCALPSEPGFHHMEWLRIQLQLLRERGMKAILIGHVPPARTESKQNWDETCWQKYTLWLDKYRDVVTGSLYGHMNIDHFLLQDTKEIDLALDATESHTRRSLSPDEDAFSIESKEDYLQELRREWSDLPGSAIKVLSEGDSEDDTIDSAKKHKSKKGDKYKKIGGKYAERYQVSLVSPSIVPNYFPTLRVFEYNITGLEDIPVWTEAFNMAGATEELPSSFTESGDDADYSQELKRDLEAEKKKKKKKKGKKKPKDPHLVIPSDPPRGSTPGPAYSPQPLTLTGYTQYFANLTYLNNDIADPDADGTRWRDGDHSDDVPQHKKPKPRDFSFEVEYETFDDKFFKLKDLTVMNYLKLAYRIGQVPKKRGKKGKGKMLDSWDDEEEDDDEQDDLATWEEDIDELDLFDDEEDVADDSDSDLDSDSDSDDESAESQKKKKGKKHKKKKKHKKNKTWLAFLSRAFVSTVPDEELKNW